MTEYRGKLLTVEANPTKEGKDRYKVQIDVDEHGLKEFTLWDTGYVGGGEKPIMDIRRHLGSRVVFEALKGGAKKDRDGNETGQFWPSNLTLISLEEPQPTKTVREMAEDFEDEDDVTHDRIRGNGALQQARMRLINAFGEWLVEAEKSLTR